MRQIRLMLRFMLRGLYFVRVRIRVWAPDKSNSKNKSDNTRSKHHSHHHNPELCCHCHCRYEYCYSCIMPPIICMGISQFILVCPRAHLALKLPHLINRERDKEKEEEEKTNLIMPDLMRYAEISIYKTCFTVRRELK